MDGGGAVAVRGAVASASVDHGAARPPLPTACLRRQHAAADLPVDFDFDYVRSAP